MVRGPCWVPDAALDHAHLIADVVVGEATSVAAIEEVAVDDALVVEKAGAGWLALEEPAYEAGKLEVKTFVAGHPCMVASEGGWRVGGTDIAKADAAAVADADAVVAAAAAASRVDEDCRSQAAACKRIHSLQVGVVVLEDPGSCPIRAYSHSSKRVVSPSEAVVCDLVGRSSCRSRVVKRKECDLGDGETEAALETEEASSVVRPIPRGVEVVYRHLLRLHHRPRRQRCSQRDLCARWVHHGSYTGPSARAYPRLCIDRASCSGRR